MMSIAALEKWPCVPDKYCEVMKYIGVTLGGLYVIKTAAGYYKCYQVTQRRNRARIQREETFKQFKNVLDKEQVSEDKQRVILQCNIDELRKKLKAGDFQPKEVLVAYGYKALSAQHNVNCVVEPLLEAFQDAERLSSDSNKHGVLYGLPVSIKDNIGIRGHDCSIGCSNWLERPFEEDSAIVKIIRAEGGIPFVKTTVPQTMLSFESSNPIHGQTQNPQDKTRGAGGSSGGEAALIASGGSIVGIGGDIGGSIRIPAAMCGIVGLKPTSYKMSSRGVHYFFGGQTNLRSTFGPMAQSVDGIVLMMQAFSQTTSFKEDPTTPPVLFNNDIYSSNKKLRIGFYTNLDFTQATPVMQRAVLLAKEKLESLGHTVIQWDFPVDTVSVMEQWSKSTSGDAGRRLCKIIENDKVDHGIKPIIQIMRLPNIVKRLLSAVLRPFNPIVSLQLINMMGVDGVTGWWELNQKTFFTKEKVMKSWKDHQLDAVICPAFACPALPIGSPGHAAGAIVYTAIYNQLDFPAGCLPVTKVSADDVKNMESYAATNMWERTIKKGMKGIEGLSVSVQVVALPWQEEMCLRVMKELEQEVAFKKE